MKFLSTEEVIDFSFFLPRSLDRFPAPHQVMLTLNGRFNVARKVPLADKVYNQSKDLQAFHHSECWLKRNFVPR